MENQIKYILIDRGYNERNAKLVAHELTLLSAPLQPLLSQWLDNEQHMEDYKAEGYTITGLMQKRGMTYPAALLTIDWLLKEPEEAKLSLSRGIK
jgi:hypothetical protein